MLGSQGEADEGLGLLGFYVMLSDIHVPTFKRDRCAPHMATVFVNTTEGNIFIIYM